MELIIKIGITFIFSSSFISLTLLMYFKLDSKIKIEKSKFVDTLVLMAFIHALFINTIPALFFTFFLLIYPPLLLSLIFNYKLSKSFISIGKIFIILFIIEAFIALILKMIFNINSANLSVTFINLIYCIPIRLIELGVVLFLKRRSLQMGLFGWFLGKPTANTKKESAKVSAESKKTESKKK